MLEDLLSPPIWRPENSLSGVYFGQLAARLSEPNQKTFTQALFLILKLLKWLYI